MKTNDIIRAFRNATSPAARLAAWQNPGYGNRSAIIANLGTIRRAMARTGPTAESEAFKNVRDKFAYCGGPELSSPEAKNPLLWCAKDSPEILETFAGRDHGLDHRGWYTDDFQDETIETYAVRLTRFPHLLFYAVLDSCNDDFRIRLDEWEEIDFEHVTDEYNADQQVTYCARQVVRSNDSTTEREAEESREYYRKDQVERDIEENKETLKGLRQEIRALAHELKTLCPSSLAIDYPAAGKALRDSLKSLLKDRRELMESNEKLAASL